MIVPLLFLDGNLGLCRLLLLTMVELSSFTEEEDEEVVVVEFERARTGAWRGGIVD
jgi:hypothetical protein